MSEWECPNCHSYVSTDIISCPTCDEITGAVNDSLQQENQKLRARVGELEGALRVISSEECGCLPTHECGIFDPIIKDLREIARKALSTKGE